ncbi:mCG142411, isoform CRA_a [Mus musculus]|nr:mCG142411, isoform CRA_a [Mus musculus]
MLRYLQNYRGWTMRWLASLWKLVNANLFQIQRTPHFSDTVAGYILYQMN